MGQNNYEVGDGPIRQLGRVETRDGERRWIFLIISRRKTTKKFKRKKVIIGVQMS